MSLQPSSKKSIPPVAEVQGIWFKTIPIAQRSLVKVRTWNLRPCGRNKSPIILAEVCRLIYRIQSHVRKLILLFPFQEVSPMPTSRLLKRRSELVCRTLSLSGCAHKTGTGPRKSNMSDRNCGTKNPRPSQFCDRRDIFFGVGFPLRT